MQQAQYPSERSRKLVRIFFAVFFFSPILGYVLGLIYWTSFHSRLIDTDFSACFRILSRTEELMRRTFDGLEMSRVQALTQFFLLGVSVQFFVALMGSIWGFVMRAILHAPGYKLPNLFQIILLLVLTLFVGSLIFYHPIDTLNDGRLGRAAVLTDYRFVWYFAVFTAFNGFLHSPSLY